MNLLTADEKEFQMATQPKPSLPSLALAPERSILVGVAGRLEEILLSHLLKENQFVTHVTDSVEHILAILERYSFDVILLDNRLAGIQEKGYAPLLEAMKSINCHTPVIGLWMDQTQVLDQTGLQALIIPPLTHEKLHLVLSRITETLT